MFGDIGLSELLVIALIIVLLTKPEEVPVVMYRLGLAMAHIRHYLQGMWLGFKEKVSGDDIS